MTDVHVHNIRFEVRTRRSTGFLCDTGASKSFVGLKELSWILNALGIQEKKILPSCNFFRYVEANYHSSGRVFIQICTSFTIARVCVNWDIFNAKIPSFFRMDVFEKESMTPCIVSSRLVKIISHTSQDWNTVHLDE